MALQGYHFWGILVLMIKYSWAHDSVATEIEGAWEEGGKGLSIYDIFTHKCAGGKLSGGVNKQGVAFYNNLINELIANGSILCVQPPYLYCMGDANNVTTKEGVKDYLGIYFYRRHLGAVQNAIKNASQVYGNPAAHVLKNQGARSIFIPDESYSSLGNRIPDLPRFQRRVIRRRLEHDEENNRSPTAASISCASTNGGGSPLFPAMIKFGLQLLFG
ncbi:hypothetical protein RHGRI_019525 [Rhododendron griersonianum]|uniref:Uncharacterized protein n=1 Tax=Rhododendron griersonianum TaxID=479676 RepID=A0AAV6JKA8_9ERIC|nr:hypothetical protein RHGRI_019525 [Rhododendron griersonianum]